MKKYENIVKFFGKHTLVYGKELIKTIDRFYNNRLLVYHMKVLHLQRTATKKYFNLIFRYFIRYKVSYFYNSSKDFTLFTILIKHLLKKNFDIDVIGIRKIDRVVIVVRHRIKPEDSRRVKSKLDLTRNPMLFVPRMNKFVELDPLPLIPRAFVKRLVKQSFYIFLKRVRQRGKIPVHGVFTLRWRRITTQTRSVRYLFLEHVLAAFTRILELLFGPRNTNINKYEKKEKKYQSQKE